MPVGNAPRPLPWVLVDECGDEVIRDGRGNAVHYDTQYYPSGLSREDAEYIVAAVNSVSRYELALYRIAGHGNITGEKARKIASEALSIKKPE